jgi:hypothetical protein
MERRPPPPSPKKPYGSPTLVPYGPVRTLTQNVSSGPTEKGNPGDQNKKKAGA